MHDIICPNCGERFLGCDVSFDISEHILPLLYENNDDREAVEQVKFKYYVDEETILMSNTTEDPELLKCENLGGPGFNDPGFSFRVNGSILYDYIQSKSGYEASELDNIFENINDLVDGNDFSRITPLHLSQISTLYHVLFDVSDRLVGDISIDDELVRTAIKVLLHVYNNRSDIFASNSLDLRVSLYSSNTNGREGYHVPDIMFVKRNGRFERISKCCRFCGRPLPLEFGYYKMKPVVLLGSHAAGKTSYLLALLNTIQSKAPFITDKPLETKTLQYDFNLTAFMNNIQRFREGLAPNKTDFENVPILNLKIHDTIYSFIDWPGEKFININGADEDYIYKSKRVITHASHIFFFLPPEQIDESLPQPEENVCFDIMSLSQSLATHLSFPDRRRIKSLTYVANKVDKLSGRANTEAVFNFVTTKSEVDMYNGSRWCANEFENINNSAKDYLVRQNPSLFSVLNSMKSGAVEIEKFFIPVAPYGYDAEKDSDGEKRVVIHRGFLAGLPFLRILKTDGII